MNARNSNDKAKTLGFINVAVQVKAADGNWYTYKGGIPLTDKKASERGLIANPKALEDKKRVKIEASLHVIAEEPDAVKF